MLTLAHGLIGFYFIFFGLWNIYHWVPMTELMLKKRWPSPIMLLSIAIGWQIILGGMIVFGVFVKVAALLLIPFVIVFVFILHPFWDHTGELRKQHMALFVTNMTLVLGALILLFTS